MTRKRTSDDTDALILGTLRARGPKTFTDLSAACSKHPTGRDVDRSLQRLRKRGLIRFNAFRRWELT
jgi:DNA-binding Lrp family transcriptional regulator